MRSYLIFAGTLLSAAAAIAQQTGPNIVPQRALDSAFQRALKTPSLPDLTDRKTTFSRPGAAGQKPLVLMAPASKTCAIPLLPVHGDPTHDRIATAHADPGIDPKMAVAPRVPVCPTTPH